MILYRLHKNLTEHLNVEIVLNTISDMADAATWLSNTLLHIRSSKNPRQYGKLPYLFLCHFFLFDVFIVFNINIFILMNLIVLMEGMA